MERRKRPAVASIAKRFVDDLLAKLGYTGQERAETLSPEQHLELCETMMQGVEKQRELGAANG